MDISKPDTNDENEIETTSECEKQTIIESKIFLKDTNLEDLISHLKGTKPFHLRLMFMLTSILFLCGGSAVNYILAVEKIDYRCKYSSCVNTEFTHLAPNSTLDFKCHKYELVQANGACVEDNFDNSSATDCTEWVYEKPNSFVAEFNLGCEEWKRTLVGTMHSAGYMIGLFFIGPLSDKFGRKKIIIVYTFLMGIIGITKSMVTSYWLFIALETLESMFEHYSTVYTLGIEMMTSENRPIMICLFAAQGTLVDICLAYLAYLTPNWRMFLVLLYAPTFLALILIIWIDESVRWLLINEKKKEAERIIKRAVKLNKVAIDDSMIANMKYEGESSATLRASLKITFSSRTLFIRLILCICIMFTALFNLYCLLINSVLLEGNKYVNFGLVALSNVTSGILLLVVLKKLKREQSLTFSLLLTGVFCISQSFVPKGYRWLSIVLYMCGVVNSSITIKTLYLYIAELFPTYTRNTMISLCSALGRFGAILAPLTPLLFEYWSGLPAFLVGVMSIVTAFIITFMPDTSEHELPDDVKQAEAIGIQKKNEKGQEKRGIANT